MAFLGSCFFIIESLVTANRFLKWFYLRFYMHPAVLILCQVIIWLKVLQQWLSYPFRTIIGFWLTQILSPLRGGDPEELFYDLEEMENHQQSVMHSHSCGRTTPLPLTYAVTPADKIHEEDFDSGGEEDNLDKDESSSFCCPSCTDSQENEEINPDDQSSDLFSDSKTFENWSLPEEVKLSSSSNDDMSSTYNGSDFHEENRDEFYETYIERMRWFDMLNYERACGSSEIKKKKLDGSWNVLWREAEKKLMTSIERDFELVYVAQACLSWEALRYNYTMLGEMICSGLTFVFHHEACKEFQKFQVLLERYIEDEKSGEVKRASYFVRSRLSIKSLLQVPHLLGFVEGGERGVGSESVDTTEALKAVEKCIEAFHEFVKTESKGSHFWETISRSWIWSHPPVEDPRDFKHFADLTKSLQRKQRRLKELEAKYRRWFKKSHRPNNPLGFLKEHDIQFTTVDLKLVSRVLQTPLLSSSQLTWCQHKLDSISFKDDKVFRQCKFPLFPTS